MKNPKLRFPEFADGWRQCKFEDVVTIGSGKDYKHLESGTIPVYGTGGYMLSVNESLSENKDAVGIGRKGTIDKPYILKAPFWTVDTLFYCIPNEGFDLIFTNCLFQNVDWKKKDESTGVPSLSKVIINNVKTYVPSLLEQQKIASLFTELDKLIQSAEKELDGYRELKRGMLQKMFPKKGEKVPEIRFPEFTGNWEQRKFNELYKKVNHKNDMTYGISHIISVANMYYKKDAVVKNEEYLKTYNIFELGDIAFEGNKSKNFAHGRFVENTIGNGIVSHVFDVFKPISNYDLMFWKYLINNEAVMGKVMARCTKSSTMMTNLVAKDFLNESILVPTIEEQQKIGTYLSNLDNLITLHQKELDGYKELKKGLLQQMFC